MEFLKLLQTEVSLDLRRMVAMSIIAGLSNAAVLALINIAANRRDTADGWRLALMFVIVVAAYSVSQRFVMVRSAREVERIAHRIRGRLIEGLRRCELRDVERIGRARILTAMSTDIQTVAQSGNILGLVGQLAVLLVFAAVYLFVLSPMALVLFVAFMAVAVVLYYARRSRSNKAMQDAAIAEIGLHELLSGILDGFKEAKLNRHRSEQLITDITAHSEQAAEARSLAQAEFGRNFVFTQNVFFLLLATMVFILPTLSEVYSDTMVKTTTAVLFLFGPVSGVIAAMPVFASANIAAKSIMELERLLQQSSAQHPSANSSADAERASFREIALRGVRFRFEHAPGEQSFQVGPIDLVLKAGETVIISGGNGSGKSTLLRLLTALYSPQAGEILLDGRLSVPGDADSYRSLFSAVFSDYHLFKRLYGIMPEALEEAPDLLHRFEVDDKTSVVGGAFTTIDLSAGQRKRLALIVAILETRPICVLDEWAADQDPIFRRKFYTELLAMLKQRGVTVIAVSHDERYFDCADRRLHMEEGKFVSDQGGIHA